MTDAITQAYQAYALHDVSNVGDGLDAPKKHALLVASKEGYNRKLEKLIDQGPTSRSPISQAPRLWAWPPSQAISNACAYLSKPAPIWSAKALAAGP